MKIFYYILSFLVVLACPSTAVESLRMEEVITREQAQKINPLYNKYYYEPITETEFLERWEEAHKDSGYHMVAAFNENSNAVAFIDGTIFASLYWKNKLMRIDSFYIDQNLAQNQEQLSRLLFGSIEEIARKNNVRQIQCNTRRVHEQEVKLFNFNMFFEEEAMFYTKNLVEK